MFEYNNTIKEKEIVMKLFGTDGIRDTADTLIKESIPLHLGYAIGKELEPCCKRRVLIGRDTRASGKAIEDMLIRGLTESRCSVYSVGIISTPGISYLTKKGEFDMGVMISASHNPHEYNGLKVFGSDGKKLNDGKEEELERDIFAGLTPHSQRGTHEYCPALLEEYKRHLKSAFAGRVPDIRIALDLANGSATAYAKEIFDEISKDITVIGNEPSGTNINLDCGSTCIATLARTVIESRCDIGLAFDGDADRCIAVDETGDVIDGDNIIAVLAEKYLRAGKLYGNAVAGTVMTNIGLIDYLDALGIDFIETAVGDRHISEAMDSYGLMLGGESSGHVIISEYADSGDGVLTALALLSAMRDLDCRASALRGKIQKYPSCNLSIGANAAEKERFNACREIDALIMRQKEVIAAKGKARIVVRPSGTEPKIRISVECKDAEAARSCAVRIQKSICELLAIKEKP